MFFLSINSFLFTCNVSLNLLPNLISQFRLVIQMAQGRSLNKSEVVVGGCTFNVQPIQSFTQDGRGRPPRDFCRHKVCNGMGKLFQIWTVFCNVLEPFLNPLECQRFLNFFFNVSVPHIIPFTICSLPYCIIQFLSMKDKSPFTRSDQSCLPVCFSLSCSDGFAPSEKGLSC